MKLSKLVGYINLLDSAELMPASDQSLSRLLEIQHVVTNHQVQIDNFADRFENDIQNILHGYASAHQTLQDLKSQLQNQLATMELSQYQASQQLYEQEMCYETNEYILNRKLNTDPDSKLALVAKLLQYTDWRLPGLIIRPGLEQFIEHLVPLDPLYVVDQHDELITPAIKAFTPAYQRRLRSYLIDDYNHRDALWQLPSNQFGLIFAYNYLNYKPLKVICQYLHSMYHKLRPGGVAIFTFNDCDWAHGVALAEKNFMCYTPGREIKHACNEVGFEVLSTNRASGDLTWIELQKPGEIESIRGGQSLAKIIAIH